MKSSDHRKSIKMKREIPPFYMVEEEKALRILEDFEKLELSVSSLPETVRILMQLVETIEDTSGPAKKAIVTRAVCKLIDKSDACGAFEGVVLELVPALCDAFIGVDKTGLFFKQPSCCDFLGKIRLGKG